MNSVLKACIRTPAHPSLSAVVARSDDALIVRAYHLGFAKRRWSKTVHTVRLDPDVDGWQWMRKVHQTTSLAFMRNRRLLSISMSYSREGAR